MAADDPTSEVRRELGLLRGDLNALVDKQDGCYQTLLARVIALEKRMLPGTSKVSAELNPSLEGAQRATP